MNCNLRIVYRNDLIVKLAHKCGINNLAICSKLIMNYDSEFFFSLKRSWTLDIFLMLMVINYPIITTFFYFKRFIEHLLYLCKALC